MANGNGKVVLSQWYRNAWLQKWWLPRDFLDQTGHVDGESFICIKRTVRSMTLREGKRTKTLKIKQTSAYSRDVTYVPAEFKNETVHILVDGIRAACVSCSGRGEVPCPPEIDCPTCHGSTRTRERCIHCGGGGNVTMRPGDLTTLRNCGYCSGNGTVMVDCTRCYSRLGQLGGPTGKVLCSTCSGSGAIPCKSCDAEGDVIRGTVLTRKFSSKVHAEHNIDGLGKNRFKNGLRGCLKRVQLVWTHEGREGGVGRSVGVWNDQLIPATSATENGNCGNPCYLRPSRAGGRSPTRDGRSSTPSATCCAPAAPGGCCPMTCRRGALCSITSAPGVGTELGSGPTTRCTPCCGRLRAGRPAPARPSSTASR